MRTGILLLVSIAAASGQAPTLPEAKWRDIRELGLEGRGWTKTRHPFDRLPAHAEGVVRPPVWTLAMDSAGMSGRFVTDAQWIRVRWRLRKERLAMPHMPATGVSGVDLYTRDRGGWRWVGVGRPERFPANEAVVAQGLAGDRREYLLYLPLYNGVESVEIGIPSEAVIERAEPRPAAMKPLVFYGTSILHGGCASRPGMAYPSIVGRRLDWPVINLGFSGNAKSEPEMAKLLAELDPAVYVLDSLPNLQPQEVRERVEPFVQVLREKHPLTPIVMVENVIYTNGNFIEARRKRYAESNAALRLIHQKLVKSGDRNLYYVPGDDLLGDDGEGTVDGTHPTDLGFVRMAEVVSRTLAPLLKRDAPRAAEPGFRSLFDGQTLTGWRRHTGVPKEHVGGRWEVAEGAITGFQDPPGKGGFLVTEEQFGDFVLRLEAKLDYPVDSGIFLRMGDDGKSHQVTLDYRPGGDLGGIYLPWTQNMVLRNPDGIEAFRPGQWNDVEVRIEGEPARIQCRLNGKLITDFRHTEATTKGVPRRGYIGLQVHPDVGRLTLWKEGNRVRFRNIRIQTPGRRGQR